MSELTTRLATALSDRYKIERELGEGGMATVYLAKDLKHDRSVALKVLKPELAAVIGAERFLNEIKVTANLQHPHILPLHDSGEADSFLYYVMPYVEGESLRDKLDREKQLAVDETVEIAKSVAAALDYAHRHHVIHRDIKPENILLHDGQALVADFGIALAVSEAGGTRLTETGLSLGTPHYMSPEQATADRELTSRSDIYSLGCVTYEMLVGDPPHTAATAQAVIAKIVTDEPQRITAHRKSVPPHVEGAVHMAIEKLPADRFSTAAEFADALTNPAFAPVTAVRPAPGGLWNWVSVSATSVALVLTVIALWGWLRPTPQSVAKLSLALPAGEELQLGFSRTIALSPDGSRFAYIGPGDGAVKLWLREFDQLAATPLGGTAGGSDPFFSPDGQELAFFVGAPARLDVVPLGGGGPARTVIQSDLRVATGDWGPDGYLYFTALQGLSRVPANGGEAEVVTVLDTTRGDTSHRSPDVLPNGKGVLFTVAPSSTINLDEYVVAVVELASGDVQVLAPGTFARYAASGHLLTVRADGTLFAAPFDQEKLVLTGTATPLVEDIRRVGLLGVADLTLSESGSLLYGTGGGVAERLVWVARDGTVQGIDPDWTTNFESVALSPDGTRLAVSTQSDVWIKDLAGGPARRLTFEGDINFRPKWRPDGQAVTFLSDRTGLDLYSKRADGGGPAELLVRGERRLAEGSWTPDGQWLLYRTTVLETGSGDILGIRPTGDSSEVALVATEFLETTAAVSPDGKSLAYVSNQTGPLEIHVRPFPNTADGQWQVSTGGGTEPVWAHSGRELFYRNGVGDLVAVEVTTTPTFSMGAHRVLFPAVSYATGLGVFAAYAVSPDDQRFVMIRVEDAGEGELILVQNFFEELTAKVGN